MTDHTPLQCAQIFESANEALRESIVDGLRRAGWSREDAVEMADSKIAAFLQKKEQTND